MQLLHRSQPHTVPDTGRKDNQMNTLILHATTEGWTATAMGPWAAAIVALFGVATLRLAGVHAGAPTEAVRAQPCNYPGINNPTGAPPCKPSPPPPTR
jgi:hypothetical protein